MSAVDTLLQRLTEVDVAYDALTSTSQSLDPSIESMVKRGIALSGFVALEEFLRNRGTEWSRAITAARISPLSWPNSSSIHERMMGTIQRRYKDEPVRELFVADLGESLGSFSKGELVCHASAFGWSGSNLQANDVEDMGIMLGFGQGRSWSELTSFWATVRRGTFSNVNVKTLFEEVASIRHAAAHQGQPALPIATLGSITRNVRTVAICIDCVFSQRINSLIQQTGPHKVSATPVRRLIDYDNHWREYSPTAKSKATARHPTLDDAKSATYRFAQSRSEVVLAMSNSEFMDWKTAI